MTKIHLVTRGDDAGSCHSANCAILEAAQQGILRNIGFMVCCPHFPEAARMLRDLPHVAFGLHVTLNAEWEKVKWGPVLAKSRVPDLVTPEGYFTQTPTVLHERQASVDQMIAEIEAQLELARSQGLRISYIDEHMGVGWVNGLRQRIADLAAREGLVDAHHFRGLPAAPQAQGGDPATVLIERLRVAEPGVYVFVTHPGLDAEDMRQMYHAPMKPGDVARQRDEDRRLLLSPEVRRACDELKVELSRYPDAYRLL